MLSPKKMKFRKGSKGRIRGQARAGNHLAFGDYGIMAVEHGRITARQIEASRIAMTRHIKRGGKVWIKVFPHHPVSKKPAEVRMGKGKGSIDRYEARIHSGRILFEMHGVEKGIAIEALKLAAAKLPVKTKLIILGNDPWVLDDKKPFVAKKKGKLDEDLDAAPAAEAAPAEGDAPAEGGDSKAEEKK